MTDRFSREEAHKQYLQKTVNPIMEKLVMDLLLEKPEDVLEFIQKWVQDNGKKIVQKLKNKNNSDVQQKNKNAYGEHSSESDEDDEIEELVQKQHFSSASQNPIIKKGARQSVSAEVYGKFNQKALFVPKVVPKSAETYQRIEQKLLQAFMFSALDDKERDIVIKAMEERKFKKGDHVIKQGEDGDILFLVDQGQLDCYKQFKKDEEPKHLKVYNPGESFGELALLYNAPRAATIIAKTDAVLFALDRDCFNNIVKDAAAKKREGYENLLSKIEILGEMDPYERTQIADALKPMKFKAGDYVVKEGDQGNTFFFVEQGTAKAYKIINKDKDPVLVMNYKAGDYFGELSLLRDQPRAASIIADSDLILASLERQSFKRLLGPLEDLLKRNFSKYQNYLI